MLTDADYHFIVETLAATPTERSRLLADLRRDPDAQDRLLEDERLINRLREDEEQILRISPRLLFAILLRQVRRDLEQQRYTLERLGLTERVPVFDAGAVRSVLADRRLLDYLVDMLASFVRTETITVLRRRAGRMEQRRLSTLSIDDMIELAALLDEEARFPLYKRIADIALFTSGIFADHVTRGAVRTGAQALGLWMDERRLRGLEEYEEEGRRFYRLAAAHSVARALRLDRVLDRLAEEFPLVRKPLAVMADRYMTWTRLRLFEGPAAAQ